MPDLKKLHNQAMALKEKKQAAQPKAARDWFRIQNATSDVATIHLYDMIGDDGWGGGITASDFVNELAHVSAPRLVVNVNSEGGEVFDGIAIYEALKQHPAHVTVNVQSLAASAASFITMAGDRIEIARNARMMIHDAAMGGAYAAGNAADMREFIKSVEQMADLLDDMSLNIADIYAQRAGGTKEEWRARMQAETWYDADAAVSAGLADGVIGEPETSEPTPAPEQHNAFDTSALLAALKGAFA